MSLCIPEVVKAMRACVKEKGKGKVFSAKTYTGVLNKLITCDEYILLIHASTSSYGKTERNASGNC